MQQQDINILERIHACYYQLSAAERKVADNVLAQTSRVQFMSITQLADECGVAEATVSRFCRNLQLKGFNAFKIEVAKHAATSTAGRLRELPVNADSFAGRCQAVGHASQEAIVQTVELAQQEIFEKTVALFEQTDRVVCVGSGASMIMATEFAHLFSTVTRKFTAVSDSHMQMSTVGTMCPGEVVVLFSYSGATNSGIEVLELARSRGVFTVLVTHFPKSPAASMADIVLRCGANESPFQLGSIPARVAQLIVMDLLFQEYYRRNHERCEENLQLIAAALSGKHV